MTEGAVTNVVYQGSREGDVFTSLQPLPIAPLPDNLHEFPGCVEHPNAMCETSMRCPRIYKLGKAKLPNTPKPLKRFAANCLPQCTLQLLIGIKCDQVMKRVADSLLSHGLQCVPRFAMSCNTYRGGHLYPQHKMLRIDQNRDHRPLSGRP